MDIQREIADKYQGLFNLMSKEHNLTLTISEMDQIIIEAQKVVNKISSKPVLCDSLPPCSKCGMPIHPVLGAFCAMEDCINKKR